MKNILITGATSFLGRNLIEQDIENHYVKLTREKCDLSKPIDISKLPKDVDTIIHAATSRYIHEFPEYAHDIFSINVSATQALLEHAKNIGADKFIFISTFNVDSEVHPTFYTRTKKCAELLAEAYREHMKVIILRPIYIYGNGQEGNRLIPKLINNIKQGRKIYINSFSGIRISPIHITDMINCIQKSIDIPTSLTVDLGGPDIVSIRELANKIGEILEMEPIFERLDNPNSVDMFNNPLNQVLFFRKPIIDMTLGLLDATREYT